MKRTPALFAALLLAMTSVLSCGEAADETTADTAAAAGETTAETEAPGWQYPDVDYGGQHYRIYNLDQLWNMYIHMDVTEQTGEVLNDAVYQRNRAIEEAMNVVIEEKQMTYTTWEDVGRMAENAQNSVMAGADEYDVMMMAVEQKLSLVTEGCLLDLMSVEGLHMSEPWWDQDVIVQTTLKDKLYFVSGASTLMAFDSMWCLFFNENMMEEQNLEKPYDLVREGKWTLDKLTEYASAVANLNGDSAFAWNKDGSCTWGISAMYRAAENFMFGSGIRVVEVQPDGTIPMVMENDNFYRAIDKLAILLNGKTGMTIQADTDDFNADKGGYMYIFQNRRSLFLTAEVKAAQQLRNMEDTFGIVPFPKADEVQENYNTSMVSTMLYLTIPTTNKNLAMTADVSEAMAHDSYENVLPVYYNNVVEHKGLRNEDSVEMLEIMRQGRSVDMATVFGWGTSINGAIRGKLFAGDNQVASVVASQKASVEAAVAEFLEFLKD